ncbi:MAG: replication-associated recombination protein A [Bacteroidetes bacterium]|nr:MAG: replication-associated recombination protein A [Bacteroidota bacterium]MBL1145076.1 replication-associated recombination protein A [Bacteroidota bacterium]NOG57873.1 replication-associated recombination protein A [Bacteroidota bacterium]
MSNKPLAERMRPKNLDEYVGQKHLVGEGTALRKLIEKGMVPSMILWGSPGIGKTTLANIIANTTDRPFFTLSAINSGVKDVREIIQNAKKQQFFASQNPILFIDEIHRFSKSQQDSLLGAVEDGTITLIGATTENPSFEVISALLSRCQVYTLEPLNKEELLGLVHHALKQDEVLSKKKVQLKEFHALLQLSGGDARKLLNLLDLVISNQASEKVVITDENVKQIAQQNIAKYDKDGEQHYDIISAFIKSIRGSDPNAGVYWLARMIEGGEDPKFIARRLLILASEDIGNANPTAIVMANNCFQAVNVIGWPESRIILSQCVTYLASSPKSNAAYMAINRAQEEVRKSGNLNVPLALRNAPTKLMKEIGYGKEYKYAHDFPNNFFNQNYLPEAIQGTTFYEPGENARENELRKRLKALWQEKYGY